MRRRDRRLKLKTKVAAGVGLFILAWAVVGGLYYLHYRHYQANRRVEQKDLQIDLIRQLLEEGKADRALTMVDRVQGENPTQTEELRKLQVESLSKLANVPRLVLLHQSEPDAFPQNEQAALLVARGYVHMREFERYRRIRDIWLTRPRDQRAWLALEADALLLQGKRQEAIALLASKQFEGAEDCSRLARLALLLFSEDPAHAWDLLNQAMALDSRNPDVRSIRGRVLELNGKLALARVEFVAAHLSDPRNPFFRDQLAEFYRRTGRHAMAIETWADRADPAQPSWMWLKLLFWTRVTSPAPREFTADELPPGRDSMVLEAIMKLPLGQFWSQDVENALHASGIREGEYGELRWLRVLDALVKENETAAATMLADKEFIKHTLNPAVYVRLRQVLAYRAGVREETLKLPPSSLEHSFYNGLREAADTGRMPPGLNNLVTGPEAFCMTFVAGGWLEAGLAFDRLRVVPDNYPKSVAYGIAQALRFNRGEAAALDYAARQPSSPELQMLQGEVMLGAGRVDEAAAILDTLRTQTDAVGVRAAWLLATAALNKREIDHCRTIVRENATLVDETAGQELLARADLVAGNKAAAEERYRSIVKDSTEAKVYLARKAFEEGDLETARVYTQDLVAAHPDEMQFRRNLQTIDAAANPPPAEEQ